MKTRPRTKRHRAWPRPPRSLGERGAVTLELAVLFPFVLLFTFGVIEGALYFHARNVALAAAEEGARVATADGGSVGAGIDRVHEFAGEVGNGTLSGVSVSPNPTATDVTFTVTGQPLSLVPGWGGVTVSQAASAPVDVFTAPG